MQDGASWEQQRDEARRAFNERFNNPRTIKGKDLTPEQAETVKSQFGVLPSLLDRIDKSPETHGMLNFEYAIPNTTWSQRMIFDNALHATRGDDLEQYNSWKQRAEMELTPVLGGDRYGVHLKIGEGESEHDLAKVEIRQTENGVAEVTYVCYGRDYVKNNVATTYLVNGEKVTAKVESYNVDMDDPEESLEENRRMNEMIEYERSLPDDLYDDEEE